MIIITQNKESIVNFDNVNNIYIKKNDGKSECYEIKANQNCGYSIILGTYPSLDHAKEILKEIYKYKDELEHTKFLGYTEAFWKSTTFEMPEE